MGDVVDFGGTHVRCLWVADDLVYAGAENGTLRVLDRQTLALRKTWTLPYLVSDVAAIGDAVYASLGPGELVTWGQRALKRYPELRRVDNNAPKLAVHGDELFWGTTWGDICHLTRGRLAGVKKMLCGIAIDADHIFAGYEDGKCRVFRRRDNKRIAALDVGGYVKCALGRQLFTANMRKGEITRWKDFEPEKQFSRELAGSALGIIGIHVVGSWLVTHTYEDVMVQDLDGTVAGTWKPKSGRVQDVWLDAAGMLIAAGSEVTRVKPKTLGITSLRAR